MANDVKKPAAAGNSDDVYVCALSGKQAPEGEIVRDAEEDDVLGELPVGWIRITVQRRGVNAAWVELQKRKARVLAASQAQVNAQLPPDMPPAERDEVLRDIAVSVDAQFHAIIEDTPKYISVEDEVHVYNPDADPQVAVAWKQVADVLGVAVTGT